MSGKTFYHSAHMPYVVSFSIDHQYGGTNSEQNLCDWCHENIGGRYEKWTYWSTGIWKFAKEEDAFLFKMTFL